ncbi:MAG: hypothetical protein A3F72_19870 [Bacteroidetes bacterium RIFCSPLOWO2_12_FULL_35_15]|nr:MAG: hypothetical protein A3F72_19870 [Bacteroidetes bacterium RIFCSPLOWO2_12_FULL_35_15]
MHLIGSDLPVKFLHPQIMKRFFKKKSDNKYGLVLLDVVILLIILILIGLILYAIDIFWGV